MIEAGYFDKINKKNITRIHLQNFFTCNQLKGTTWIVWLIFDNTVKVICASDYCQKKIKTGCFAVADLEFWKCIYVYIACGQGQWPLHQ